MITNLLRVTDYTQLICELVKCVMPVSLYSQQSCSFGVTQNASSLVIIGLDADLESNRQTPGRDITPMENKNIVDYSRSACKFWRVQTTTVEDIEGASCPPPLPFGDGLTPSLTVLLIVTAILYYGDTRSNFKLRGPLQNKTDQYYI